MFLASLLLSVVSFTPAFAPHPAAASYVEGFVQTRAGETTCQPGHICATLQTTKLHGCYVVNFANGSNGGTPLTVDVTQSGAAGSTTTVYWINNYYKNVQINGLATAKYYCPRY
jgi:hypothetical protein